MDLAGSPALPGKRLREAGLGVSGRRGAAFTPYSTEPSCASYHLDRDNQATFILSVYSESREVSSHAGRYQGFSVPLK